MKFAAICVALSVAAFVAGGAVGVIPMAHAAESAGPTTRRAAAIEAAYADLAAPDPVKRNTARTELMGLPRDELAMLRQVVEAHRPDSPQQAIALRDVVRHVFLATDRYEGGNTGFLGLATRASRAPVVVDLPDGKTTIGIDFSQRYAGFCAYRWLQDGDVILAVAVGGVDVSMDEGLTVAIKRIRPGTTIDVRVLRGGVPVGVRFPLDARPKAFDVYPPETVPFMNDRVSRADTYWVEHFAPLVDPDLT